MERNMKQWVGELIASPDRAALPIMTHSGIELIGHSVRDAVTDGEVHARAVLALAERYPSLASTVIMDLTVEAEAFGAEIHFPEDDSPALWDVWSATVPGSRRWPFLRSMPDVSPST